MNILHAAKCAHEAIRECNESIMDFSVVPWDEAPQNIKDSAIDGVKYLIANPNATGKDMHDNWIKFKLADGWRYGPEKNAAAKTHPSLVPYDKINAHERMKDDIFISVVRGRLAVDNGN